MGGSSSVGLGLTAYSVSNELVASLGGNPNFTMLTFMTARLPIVTLITVFIFVVGYKFTPTNYDNIVMDGMISKASNGKKGTSPHTRKEKLTYVIFAGGNYLHDYQQLC